MKGSSSASWRNGFRDGRRIGYADGWNRGLAAGRQAAMQHQAAVSAPIQKRALNVLYVTSGIGVPYPALDQSIIDALQELVQEVTVAVPSETLVQTAEAGRPDFMLALTGINVKEDQAAAIRRLGIPTAVWLTDDPYYTDWTQHIAPRFDYVFTLESSCVPFYQQLGCERVYHLPLAANPKLYMPRSADPAGGHDVCFIGTAFWNRVQTIDALAPYLAEKRTFISGWWWDRLSSYARLKEQIRLGDWLTPEETALHYSASRITLNIHRSSDDASLNHNGARIPAFSVNPRTFEISACHTLQLTDVRQDLSRYYEIGKEIVTYSSVQELKELIDYYLRHEEERREIAHRGFMRTMADHTYAQRISELLRLAFG